MYKNNIAIFCKTCKRDIKNFKILLYSILKYNKDNIPICISVSNNEREFFYEFLKPYKVIIFIDEEITNFKYNGNNEFYKCWLPQQLVKLELYKTNFASHYIIIDSDCYFIKDFYVNDFLFNNNIPYLPITDHTKAERIVLSLISEINYINSDAIIKNFFNKTCRSISIDMPFVLTSEYIKSFEDYLISVNSSFEKIILLSPFEMQWYLMYVLFFDCKYMPTTAFFMPFHIEMQYQVFRMLGFNEDCFKKNYLGILMNKGHVKSIYYKPSFTGEFVIRRIIQFIYNKTKGRKEDSKINLKNLLSNIISINNEYKNNIKHKVFTILGIKLKFKQ